jgi:pyrroloquinoline-quinone synthase
MMQSEFWMAMNSLLETYDLLRHPYYIAWRDGALTLADLREYACEYYYHVASFPVYLKQFAARLPEGHLRQSVLHNLWDELGTNGGEGIAHHRVWINFAIGTGVLARDVVNRKPIPSIQALIKTYMKIARVGSAADALAAFYVYESQVPRIAREKAASLRKIYGLDEASCRYFTMHTAADIAHSMVWRQQLDKLVESDAKAAQASLTAAERAAKALWRALDGINAMRKYSSKRNPMPN